jgi:hypothetical protein
VRRGHGHRAIGIGFSGAYLVGLRNATYASWSFFVIIVGFSLHEEWHECINEMWGQLEIVDLCLFANGSSVRSNTVEQMYEDILFNCHDQRVERHNTVFLIKIGFAARLDAEYDNLANVLRQQRGFLGEGQFTNQDKGGANPYHDEKS